MSRDSERAAATVNRNAITPFAWGLMMALLFAGCASSPRMNRIDAMRDRYEEWPIEIRQAVLEGKVEKGMTEDMVKAALGEPQEVFVRPSSPGTPEEKIWSYQPLRYPDLGGNSRDLLGRSGREPDQRPIIDQDIVFRDGVVLRIDRNRVN